MKEEVGTSMRSCILKIKDDQIQTRSFNSEI